MFDILFYTPHICLRGSSVAIRDYAFYLNSLHGLRTAVAYQPNEPRNSLDTIRRWSSLFPILNVNRPDDLQTVARRVSARYVYQLTSVNAWAPIYNSKLLIHQTGMQPLPVLERNICYSYVSEWSAAFNQPSERHPQNWVPHIVTKHQETRKGKDFRSIFGIPMNAVVLGRTGGLDTWNIPFVDSCINQALSLRSDLWFVLQNTPRRISHPRVIYLPATTSSIIKSAFINACDAMLHARIEGESFGIACGEFSIASKPVITYSGSKERSHLEILGNKALLYSNVNQLLEILHHFCPQPGDWNCYASFNPLAVTGRFINVFNIE